MFLLTLSFTIFISKVRAYNSPLQKLLNLSDSSNNKGDKSSTVDSVLLQEESQSENKNEKLSEVILPQAKNIPEAVTDPSEIEKAAQFASDATGVRKDFIMGMLVVESDLGRNPGKCTYREVESGAQDAHSRGRLSDASWQTFQNRQSIMKDLAKKLGYDYEKLQVSCNPGSAYAGTGGAMGVPQFMPDIWLDYKDRISAIVGKDNPDPWNITDGAVAMALLVSDTPGVVQHNLYAERNAAKMYLSGSISVQYDWYANQILYWSQNYSKLLG